jgi:hypothetical protein
LSLLAVAPRTRENLEPSSDYWYLTIFIKQRI